MRVRENEHAGDHPFPDEKGKAKMPREASGACLCRYSQYSQTAQTGLFALHRHSLGKHVPFDNTYIIDYKHVISKSTKSQN
jgi:hypothetical protein